VNAGLHVREGFNEKIVRRYVAAAATGTNTCAVADVR
jgi:hypothetical protein